MRYTVDLLVVTLLGLSAGCASSQATPSCPKSSATEAGFPAGARARSLYAPDEIRLGCRVRRRFLLDARLVVLEGDPKQEMLFTVRFRTGSQFEMRAALAPPQ